MELNSIKTIDVSAKEWFDKINGNSYFSGRIVLNYGMPDVETIKMPFQYGYGNQYEWEAVEVIGGIIGQPITACLSLFCRDNAIIYRTTKEVNCLKRDVVAFGENA